MFFHQPTWDTRSEKKILWSFLQRSRVGQAANTRNIRAAGPEVVQRNFWTFFIACIFSLLGAYRLKRNPKSHALPVCRRGVQTGLCLWVFWTNSDLSKFAKQSRCSSLASWSYFQPSPLRFQDGGLEFHFLPRCSHLRSSYHWTLGLEGQTTRGWFGSACA